MRTRAHLVELGQVRDSAQVCYATGMHRRPDEINQLLLDQELAVINRVELFANCQQSRGVAPNQPERFLHLRRRWILHPKQAIQFEIFAQVRRLIRRQAVRHVVQHVQVRAKLFPKRANNVGTRFIYASLDHLFSGGAFFSAGSYDPLPW